ncbi:hypothetical protein GCK72_018248 [Caenorhabditis remanei]|uniref:Uncharacterized protein n=1 Tax=Caenorhabditis remanei TaxID=31234 RepID=A0A6A5GAK8_CAERE|nr:hypothetical protein GCK72_018248 [Caenorhabditis remanei]KAF1751694.1 hypothetical protein GCK72_018248 [Caenorhabditis remanei]
MSGEESYRSPGHLPIPKKRSRGRLRKAQLSGMDDDMSCVFLMFRFLIALALFSTVSAVTLAICQNYCASVNGGASYDNCSPWISFATQTNQTCYNLCVHNCAAVYDGACMTGNGYRCCLPTTPAKTQQFKVSGCNKLYNNLV